MPTSNPRSAAKAQLVRAVVAYVERMHQGDDGWQPHLLGTGPVQALEERLCRLVGMKYAVCVSSATTGLLVAALALGLRNRSFIAPPIGYGASLAAWLACGNVPRFADVDRVTLGLDPEAARRKGRSICDLGAILAIDVDGVPSDTSGLRQVAQELGVPYVADAAESLGARVAGAHASASADVVVTSFTVGKTLAVGEGGAVLTNDRQVYERLIWHGQHPDRQRLELGLRRFNECAINARIHPLSAIWANAAFDGAMEWLTARRARARRAVRALARTALVGPSAWDCPDLEPTAFRVSLPLKRRAQRDQLVSLASQVAPALSPAPPITLLARQMAVTETVRSASRDLLDCPVALDQSLRRLVWRLLKSGSPPPRWSELLRSGK